MKIYRVEPFGNPVALNGRYDSEKEAIVSMPPASDSGSSPPCFLAEDLHEPVRRVIVEHVRRSLQADFERHKAWNEWNPNFHPGQALDGLAVRHSYLTPREYADLQRDLEPIVGQDRARLLRPGAAFTVPKAVTSIECRGWIALGAYMGISGVVVVSTRLLPKLEPFGVRTVPAIFRRDEPVLHALLVEERTDRYTVETRERMLLGSMSTVPVEGTLRVPREAITGDFFYIDGLSGRLFLTERAYEALKWTKGTGFEEWGAFE